MNKIVASVAGVGVALAAVVGVGTFVAGQRLQAALQAQALALQTPAGGAPRSFRVESVQYDKRFFGATRTVKIAMGCGEQVQRFTWRDDIRHGPLPGFQLAAARIDSQLEFDPAQREALEKSLGGALPSATLRTLVGFDGSRRSTLDLPRFSMDVADMRLLLEGLKLEATEQSDGALRYRVEMPVYSLETRAEKDVPAMRMTMRGLSAEGEGFAPVGWLLSGKGSGQMKALEVALLGEAGAASRTVFKMDDLSVVQSGSLTNDLYNVSGEMKGKASAGAMQFEGVKAKFRMERLHAPTYVQALQAFYVGGCPAADTPPEAIAAAALAPFKVLLPHNPSISLDELSLTSQGKTLKLSYRLGTDGIQAAELEQPQMAQLMKKVRFEAAMESSVPLLGEFAAAFGKPMEPAQLEQGVSQGVAQGMLVREGDSVKAQLSFKDGQLQVNGKVMPLPGQPTPTPAPDTPPQ